MQVHYSFTPPPLSSVSSGLELFKVFQEEAYSVALHPSGLHVLVGFSEKLRLMNLLVDDIRPFKEFMIRGCREVGAHCSSNSSALFGCSAFRNWS